MRNMREFGIDVSKWQGNFNFKKAKAEGVKFAILRGASGTSKDSKFETYYKQAKDQKLNVGVYLYTYAKNEAEARVEAEYLFNHCLRGKTFELPIYIDIEDKVQKSLSKAKNTAIVKAFCKTLEAKGYFVGVYASNYFFDTYLNDKELQGYAHWVAQWSRNCDYEGKTGVLGMWQFGGETNLIRTNKVAGVTCDQNYMLIDYPSRIKTRGLNGFTKVTYFRRYRGNSSSLVDALRSLGINNTFTYRTKIANKNGIKLYLGTASQNIKLLNLLKAGSLIKP